ACWPPYPADMMNQIFSPMGIPRDSIRSDYALVIAAAAMISFVKLYEEPTLARRYGAEYEAYRRAVPGWLPRRTPWRG
ncbi:hypothetical protein NKJ40_30960, partial [Mesorhizobium sp. M0119]